MFGGDRYHNKGRLPSKAADILLSDHKSPDGHYPVKTLGSSRGMEEGLVDLSTAHTLTSDNRKPCYHCLKMSDSTEMSHMLTTA
ncbi:hypothetical protein JTE90_024467 [Oedothorax gibbosus]|uniref:Uncharacterized protein n=1 Tax=Oedothorax gibbosus TaxID=931172 RepID=A0AAV6UKH9_9ARAC|nr:hypothetical protein JTE90_024467 [Oedothorax gibbosus]